MPKHLTKFEMETMVAFFARLETDCGPGPTNLATEERLRSRIARFVLTHQDVTPELAKEFRAARRCLDRGE
jgi:hypothetical protein